MYPSTLPQLGDSDNVLLGKILERLGGLASSASFDNTLLFKILVQLNSATTSAADARYVLKSGDTMTGALTLPAGGASNTSLRFGATSAFPALRDMGLVPAMLGARTADDSAAANFQAGFVWCVGTDANNNTQPVCLEVYHALSSGTPANNIGVGIDFRSDQNGGGGARQLQARIVSLATNAAVPYTTQLRFTIQTASGQLEMARIDPGGIDLPTGSGGAYRINNTQLVSTRKTGWIAATGTATRTTFITGSVTLPVLAEHVKALIDDLISHGLIGT